MDYRPAESTGFDHGRIVATSRDEKRAMTTQATGTPGPRTIEASEFEAKCLKLIDEVAESGEEIVITKNGRPVLRLLPYREKPKSWFGRDRGHRIRDSRRHHRNRSTLNGRPSPTRTAC